MKKITKFLKEDIVFKLIYKTFPTKLYLKLIYFYLMKKRLNFKDPKTLTEKIQWKKIYDKHPIYTICADKYLVRDYVREKIGKNYLIPLLFHTDNPEKIDFDIIPEPFIIKSNHGSGQLIIVRNKKNIERKRIIHQCKKWLKTNIYPIGREWQYKNIQPKILIEKLLLDNKSQVPNDYKFNCFNGKVEFIQVDMGRFENHKRIFFDRNWGLLPFTWTEKKDNKPAYYTKQKIPKPPRFSEMIQIAEKLSKDFDYVRVDLYSVNNHVYFGELTFTSGSGFLPFFPEKYDELYGKKLLLKQRK